MTFINIKQVAEHLGISEKTVYRLIKKSEIPAIKVGNQWRFNRQEVEGWLRREKPEAYVAGHLDEFLPESEPSVLIYSLLLKNRIFFDVPGKSREEVLENAMKLIPLDSQTNRKELLEAIIDREKLCSTGIGHGIALPHPRHPHEFTFMPSSVFLCFLENGIDFNAIDHIPVNKLFFVFARSVNEHLYLLKVLTRLFHEKEFLQLLESSTDKGEVLIKIKQLEKTLSLKPQYSDVS